MKLFFKRSVCAALATMALFSGCAQTATSGSETSTSTADTSSDAQQETTAFEHDPNLNPLGEFPIAKEKVTLTVAIPQHANVEDYETNKYTLEIEELANVDLVFQTFSEADALQKVQIMVNSGGELPDIFAGFNFNSSVLANFGANGAVLPLNDYYENSSYYIKDTIENIMPNPEIMQLAYAPDGNIYSVPHVANATLNQYTARAFINTTWLDNLGLDMPTTTEELQTVLEAFKNDDPNGNGQNDEIPMIGATDGWLTSPQDFLMGSYVYNPVYQNRMIIQDGSLQFAYEQEAWKQGLLYLNTLADDDLFSKLTFTQDSDQLKAMTSTTETPYVGLFMAGSASNLGNGENYLQYGAMLPLEGPEGVQNTIYFPASPSHQWVISKDCEYPELAFRIGDLMWSEEISVWSRFGEEGIDFTRAENPAEGEPVIEEEILPWGSVQNAHWYDKAPAFRDNEYAKVNTVGMHGISYEFSTAVIGMHPEDVVPPLLYTEEEQEIVDSIKVPLEEYVNECYARFITGDMDIEAEWDNYLAELKAIGIDEYREIAQAAYDRSIS